MKGSKKQIIFLGTLYSPDRENEIMHNIKTNISNAPNVFQWNLLRGLSELLCDGPEIINVLPVGTWPCQYRKLILTSKSWQYFSMKCHEIGGINLPFLKQFHREKKIKKKIKELLTNDTEVLIYSAYLPFLRSVYRLSRKVKITLIVTDLPEYYDLGKTSAIKRFFRKRNNKKIYQCMERVDRFVLLTEAMKDPLSIGDRPYTVVEGIGNSEELPLRVESTTEKEIIFYAGTLHRQFGIVELLEAYKLLNRSDVALWICGDGDARDLVEEAANQDDRIRYFGYVTSARVSELRSKATLLINPRNNDGEYTKYSFPSKTMEYMASGIPVVMHRLSGIPSDYDEHLLYIEDHSPAGIKEAMEKAFAMDRDSRKQFGEKARNFIINEKNEKKQAKKILDLIYG